MRAKVAHLKLRVLDNTPCRLATRKSRLFRVETAWLTQKAAVGLFGVQVLAIAKHLKNIFASGEQVDEAIASILETTAAGGTRDKTCFYSLDAIKKTDLLLKIKSIPFFSSQNHGSVPVLFCETAGIHFQSAASGCYPLHHAPGNDRILSHPLGSPELSHPHEDEFFDPKKWADDFFRPFRNSLKKTSIRV